MGKKPLFALHQGWSGLFWASWCLVHVVVIAGSVGSRNIAKGVLGVQQIMRLATYPIPHDGHLGLALGLA